MAEGRPDGAAHAAEAWLSRPRVEALVVAALVLLSLGLRVTYVLQSRASPFFDQPQMDALYHVEWARAFAAGEEFQDGPFFRAPLYPWLLGALFAVFGDGLLVPRLAGALLGAASTLLVYLTGRRAFDRRSGALAALLSATSWIVVFYDAELLLEVLATPLYLLGLWLALGLPEEPRRTRQLGTGVVFGLSAITRPNVLLFLPLLALWLARRGPRPGALARTAAFAAGVLLPILPVTVINALEGDRVLISYQAGVNLWIGNNPQSDGSTAIAPGTRPDWWGGFEDTHGQACAAEGGDLLPSEVSRHYVRRTLDAIANDPAWWLGHLAWKLRLFCMDWELGNNEEPHFLAARFGPVLRWLPVSTGLLAAFGLLGFAVSLRGAWARFPLWGFALVYGASVVLFFVNARFRLPVLPILMVYGAHGAWWLFAALDARRWPRALAGASAVALVAWASSAAVPAAARLNSPSNGHLLLAQAASRAGDQERAVDEYARALELWPANPIARTGIAHSGRKSFEAGDHDTAARAFRTVVRHGRADFDAAFSLGRSELAAGRSREALAAFELALTLPAPDEERYLYEAYGRAIVLCAELGNGERARELAERLVARFPADDAARATLRRLRE